LVAVRVSRAGATDTRTTPTPSAAVTLRRSPIDAGDQLDLSRRAPLEQENQRINTDKEKTMTTLSTSDVLDRHLNSFAKYDLAGILADYSSDAVLFTPAGR
jgi:hypothetical protein